MNCAPLRITRDGSSAHALNNNGLTPEIAAASGGHPVASSPLFSVAYIGPAIGINGITAIVFVDAHREVAIDTLLLIDSKASVPA